MKSWRTGNNPNVPQLVSGLKKQTVVHLYNRMLQNNKKEIYYLYKQ